MASRTRERLLETARQLFLHKGVDNTTISDIADACDKGRRTIYTYFNNKVEIYNAVIEQESDRMVAQLKEVADSPELPVVKLQRFLELRLSPDMNTTSPSSRLRSLINMDFGRTERARRKASEKVESMLGAIVDEGVRLGQFDPAQGQLLKRVAADMIRSVDALSASEEETPYRPGFGSELAQLIAFGLATKH